MTGDAVPPPGFVPITLPSGFLELTGPYFERRGPGGYAMGVRTTPPLSNIAGVMHGGMIATLCDMALIRGAIHKAGEDMFLLTVSLNIDYIGGAPVGSWVEVAVDVPRVGGRLVFANGDVTADGKPVAHATAIFARTERRKDDP